MMPTVHIITPALADANNGNWQTARRWGHFLQPQYRVQLAKSWEPSRTMPGEGGYEQEVMIALHARRSAAWLAAFSKTGRPCALVLTGTDLYRDIHSDTQAQASLELAHFLVVLHEQGISDLPKKYHSKARVIFQSAPRLKPYSRLGEGRYFDLALIGHVRAEKDPMTALRAMTRFSKTGLDEKIRLIHIGSDKDETLGTQFRSEASKMSQVQLKGPLTHAATRQRIKRCQLLVLPSVMEGGANVLIEAVQSGVPVLASRISGSVGMLGEDYKGYFEVGDDQALASLIKQCQRDASFLQILQQQCQARASFFEPTRERDLVRGLINELSLLR